MNRLVCGKNSISVPGKVANRHKVRKVKRRSESVRTGLPGAALKGLRPVKIAVMQALSLVRTI